METNQDMHEVVAPIELALVAEEDRLEYLPRFNNNILLMIQIEQAVYRMMDSLCDEYSGGYWDYYNMSNDGFLMSLATEEPLTLSSPNGHVATVSARQASIVAILMALSALSFRAYEAGNAEDNWLFVDLHVKLVNYVHQMPATQSSVIYQLID